MGQFVICFRGCEAKSAFSNLLFFQAFIQMPGRREDGVWRCFEKSKPKDKSYPIGTCKGCKAIVTGVQRVFFNYVQFIWYRPD